MPYVKGAEDRPPAPFSISAYSVVVVLAPSSVEGRSAPAGPCARGRTAYGLQSKPLLYRSSISATVRALS